MNDQFTTWKNENGLSPFIVLVYDNNWELPNEAFCKAFQAQIGMTVPLLYDPTGATHIYRRMSDDKVHETSLVTNEEGVIAFKMHSDTPTGITTNILAELAADLGECSSAAVCEDDQSCLPSPAGEGKLCAEMCNVDDNDCPEGKTCWSYGSATGACFDDAVVEAAGN